MPATSLPPRSGRRNGSAQVGDTGIAARLPTRQIVVVQVSVGTAVICPIVSELIEAIQIAAWVSLGLGKGPAPRIVAKRVGAPAGCRHHLYIARPPGIRHRALRAGRTG